VVLTVEERQGRIMQNGLRRCAWAQWALKVNWVFCQ
jgi:hypothetical protein